MSKHTLSVLVENKPGVLARIAALFSRRGFNIDSLAVGPTEHPEISRMTVVVDVEDLPLEQVTKQLNKLVEVLKVVELEPHASVQREILLVKVRADAAHPQPGPRDGAAVPRQGRRRRHRHPDHRGHRQLATSSQRPARRPRALRRQGARPVRAWSPSGAVRARSPTGPCAAPEPHRRRRGRRAATTGIPSRYRPEAQQTHLHHPKHAPTTRRSGHRWPRCSTTTTPTCPSSRARRSPSSATAARATPTRSTCATPGSTSASASPRAARAAPRPRPRA